MCLALTLNLRSALRTRPLSYCPSRQFYNYAARITTAAHKNLRVGLFQLVLQEPNSHLQRDLSETITGGSIIPQVKTHKLCAEKIFSVKGVLLLS